MVSAKPSTNSVKDVKEKKIKRVQSCLFKGLVALFDDCLCVLGLIWHYPTSYLHGRLNRPNRFRQLRGFLAVFVQLFGMAFKLAEYLIH